MAYIDVKNPRYRFLEYSSDEELFYDILYSFPKKSRRDKFASAIENCNRAAKGSILTIIVAVLFIMIGFTTFGLIATPEYLVKNEITAIATDYYENYFYNRILDNNFLTTDSPDFSESTMEKIMDKYIDRGFANVSLRQLLLYDNKKHAAATPLLEEYCNLDASSIRIYPEAPFDRQNYRVDYKYSCKF